MAYEIRVPRLGWSMEEGTFIRWLKADGDLVRAGEPLFELEGEKALQEIEAVDSGTLRVDPACPAEGTVVAVGACLGHLLEPGEELASREPDTRARSEQDRRQDPGDRRPASGEVRHAPPAAPAHGQAKSSPRARRVAAELAIDWQALPGTGRGGRVRERDVRQAALAAEANAAQSGSITLTNRRRLIAERMAASSAQTAPVTLTIRADATNLVDQRRRLQAGNGLVPSYTDMIASLTALVLRDHRLLAARWQGERLVLPRDDGIHIGIAVDTDEGLLVPVIRDVARRSLAEIAAESRRLIDRARSGGLTAADMQGGVFTITNLGAYGIDAFTPIINLPEVAILGLGAIRPEAAVLDDGRVAVRQIVTLSLTFDHRALDGAPAARFLRSLSAAIASSE